MSHLEPLLEEFFIALGLMTVLAVIVALLFWWVTGQSPWPYVVIAEIGAFGWGTAMLALASPRNRRR
jgi:membrane protein YdbS with pleckstrin-like domain